MSFYRALVGALLIGLASCKPPPQTPPSPAEGQAPYSTEGAAAAKQSSGSRALPPPPAEIWKEFSGDRAFSEVRAQVELGPRSAGTEALERARKLITEGLQRSGWEVTRQEFTDETPRGPVKFINLVGRFSPAGTQPAPADTQRAIVCSHFDTKRYSTINFVGANDGASSTGALIELARVLALDPAMAEKIELVFFDGEEAFAQFTETDGLHGSRYYARDLSESSRARQFQFGVLWDMIGDKDLTITLSPDTPKELAQGIFASADALGLRSHFTYFDQPIWDDHVPLNQIRIPTINLIDFDYLYWHTQDDTLDKVSPESLQKIGAVTLHYLRQRLSR